MKKWKPVAAVVLSVATLASVSFANQPARRAFVSSETSARTALALATPPVALVSVNAHGKDRFIGAIARAAISVAKSAVGPAKSTVGRLRQIAGWSTAAGRGSSPQKEKDDDKDKLDSAVLRSAAAARLFDDM